MAKRAVVQPARWEPPQNRDYNIPYQRLVVDRENTDLAAMVSHVRAELNANKSTLFFRGHADSRFSLLPGLFRDGSWHLAEAEIYREVQRRLPPNERITNEGSWQLLGRMQHHGIPTRLLDWTDSFAVALYFAIRSGGPSPCVWILDAVGLNHDSTGRSELLSLPHPTLPDYETGFVTTKSWNHRRPLAVQTHWSFDRIRSQRGYFTVHGNDADPIEQTSAKRLALIEVSPEGRGIAEDFLYLAGVDESALFPDFDGLARWIRWRFLRSTPGGA